MSKNMKPISLSMDSETHETLRKKANAKGQKISDFVRQLLSYFVLDRDDIKPVVLQIPKEALSSREQLEKWLAQKNSALLNQFFPYVESGKIPSLPWEKCD